MTKDEIISEVGRPFFKPLSLLQMFFLLVLLCSPFVWIWFDFSLATKVGLTGFVGALIVTPIYNLVKKTIKKTVEEELEKLNNNPPTKSRFQMKLEEMQNRKHNQN